MSVYGDTLGIATVGIGVNIDPNMVKANYDEFLKVIKFNPGVSPAATTANQKIMGILNSDWPSRSPKYPNVDQSLIAEINRYLKPFGTNINIDSTESDELFNYVLTNTINALNKSLGSSFPAIPNLDGSNSASVSSEIAALLILKYQAPGLVGPGIISALSLGARAQIWYDIRYRNNKPPMTDFAKNRYLQSAIFGLAADYSPLDKSVATVAEDALGVVQENYKDIIQPYDKTYESQISAANRDFGNLGINIQGLTASLEEAASQILNIDLYDDLFLNNELKGFSIDENPDDYSVTKDGLLQDTSQSIVFTSDIPEQFSPGAKPTNIIHNFSTYKYAVIIGAVSGDILYDAGYIKGSILIGDANNITFNQQYQAETYVVDSKDYGTVNVSLAVVTLNGTNEVVNVTSHGSNDPSVIIDGSGDRSQDVLTFDGIAIKGGSYFDPSGTYNYSQNSIRFQYPGIPSTAVANLFAQDEAYLSGLQLFNTTNSNGVFQGTTLSGGAFSFYGSTYIYANVTSSLVSAHKLLIEYSGDVPGTFGSQVPGALTIEIVDITNIGSFYDGVIRIDNFKNGDFGINVENWAPSSSPPPPPPPPPPLSPPPPPPPPTAPDNMVPLNTTPTSPTLLASTTDNAVLPPNEILGTSGRDSLDGKLSTGNIFDGQGAPVGSEDYESGAGNGDTFLFNQGYGTLEINEFNGSGSAVNVLQLGAGITPAMVTVRTNSQGNEAILVIGNSGDKIILDYMLTDPGVQGVQEVAFADGTVWSAATIVAMLSTIGTSGSDTIYGSAAASVFDGLGAPAGGTDTEYGSNGADTFIFNAGYGSLEINQVARTGNPASVLELGAGIDPSQVTVHGTAKGQIILDIGDQGDSITLDYMLSDSPTAGVDRVDFANGAVWTAAQILAMATTGTTGNDTIYGSGTGSVIGGRGGDDTEISTSGNDTFVFNQGYGRLEIQTQYSATPPNSVLLLGDHIAPGSVKVTADSAGDIVLTLGDNGDQVILDQVLTVPNSGVQSVEFADGTVWTAAQLLGFLDTVGTVGSDTIYGTPGADVFDGLGGNDTEIGEGGGDTFLFNSGYGHLEIDENNQQLGTNNILKFGPGITAASIASVRFDSQGNLLLTLTNAGDQVLIDSQGLGSQYGIQIIEFSDGTSLTAAQLQALATQGTSGADMLTGTTGADLFDGKGGDDTEIGDGGGDTFKFNQGYGRLVIQEYDLNPKPMNILQFGSGISAASVAVAGDADGDIILTIGQTGDQVILDQMLQSANAGVQSVQFADGTVWNAAQILAAETVGTSGSDTLYGSYGTNVFDGRGGNDTEISDGNNDSFIFNQGYGTLEISEHASTSTTANTLILGAGINPSAVTVTSDANGDIILTPGNNGDRITLDGMLTDQTQGVQTVQFANGTIWTAAQILGMLNTTGTSGSDTLYGNAAGDVFDGRGGAKRDIG